MKKKLVKSEKNKMLCGVCGGFAEFFNCDPTIIRIIAILFCLFKGIGLIFYLLCALIMPGSARDDFSDISNEELNNMKSANSLEENDNNSEPFTKKVHIEEKTSPHSDEEFNSFFDKKHQ